MKLPTETENLFSVLRQSAKPKAVSAIEELIQDAPDRELCRINALAFAARHGLDEDDVIGAFLHGARLGVFDMSWNILCPACGGILDSGATLKTVRQGEYRCVLCARGREPTLDEMVEVTFTISPRVRRIAGTIPGHCPGSNTIDRSFGVQASICPMTRHSRNGLRKRRSTAASFHLAKRWCSRSSCLKERWTCSTRSFTCRNILK